VHELQSEDAIAITAGRLHAFRRFRIPISLAFLLIVGGCFLLAGPSKFAQIAITFVLMVAPLLSGAVLAFVQMRKRSKASVAIFLLALATSIFLPSLYFFVAVGDPDPIPLLQALPQALKVAGVALAGTIVVWLFYFGLARLFAHRDG
jgi:hypothetical protein